MGVSDGDYTPSQLAKLLHELPHINITLQKVNSTFAIQSKVYLESLGIIASIPAAWLLVTLVILLLYLSSKCCEGRSHKSSDRGRKGGKEGKSSAPLTAPRLFLAAAALLCAATTGLGLYANDDLHNGCLQVLSSAKQLVNIVSNVRNQTRTISDSLSNSIQPHLTDLGDIFENPVSNTTALAKLDAALSAVKRNATNAERAAKEIAKPLVKLGVGIPGVTQSAASKWEMIRWSAAMGILSALLALCGAALAGAARRSRRCLVATSVLALIGSAAAWLLAAGGLAITVAMADFCVDPDSHVASYLVGSPEIVHYYTHCEPHRANPFTQKLREAQQNVARMRMGLGTVTPIALDLFKNRELQPKLSALTTEVNAADRGLASLAALLDCRAPYTQWVSAMKGLCGGALLGLALLTLSLAVAGLLLSILVCLASHTWIYLRKRRDYSPVDESDPFLPSGSAASQAVAARTLQAGTLPRGPPHHHRSQGSYSTSFPVPAAAKAVDAIGSLGPPPSYVAALQLDQHRLAAEKLQNKAGPSPQSHQLPTAPLPFQFFDELDGCDNRHSLTLGRDGQGSHISHLRSGHATLGRLPSHASAHHDLSGPNNGKYATLSKQCKTLESSDFY